VGILSGRRSAGGMAVAVLAAVALAAACDQAAPSPAGSSRSPAQPPPASPVFRPAGPHGGVNLRVLVLTDKSPAVEAIRHQLAVEGVPVTVLSLRDAARPRITGTYLSRTLASGVRGGNFNGIVLPGPDPAGLSGSEQRALARYERSFRVRQVDAYSPPAAANGMSAPVYSGKLRGAISPTGAGSRGGFGYLRQSVPFAGGAAGQAPFGYLARPLAGASVTPLVNAAIPGTPGSATLVWQFATGGRQQLGVGFGYSEFMPQARYLTHGIVSWLTRGVYLGYWRNYLTVDYDDVINAGAQWSTQGHCTPGAGICPKGTRQTALIRMKPADVSYAVRWQRQHDFTMEFLYNGGSAARFEVHGTDPLLAAFKPVAGDFYWVNHTYTHADLGCKQDRSVVPWRCVRSGGHIVYAPASLIKSQIADNFTWARQNGIPAEQHVVATGGYSGLRIFPQQPADSPYLLDELRAEAIKWIVLDASRDPDMRRVGPALGIPRHPIDVGYDVDQIPEEINEYNWFNTSKADGGGGFCDHSKVMSCSTPVNQKTGWTDRILPLAVQIAFSDVLDSDPRPFFMHQANLTGDRLGYPVMDGILAAYRKVFADSAPFLNVPLPAVGVAMRDQQLWSQARQGGRVTAWISGRTLTISAPPGTTVPVTAPPGTTVRTPAGPAFGRAYGTEVSGYLRVGSGLSRLDISSAPFRSVREKAPASHSASASPSASAGRAQSGPARPLGRQEAGQPAG
jgi:hypothetical protein